MKNKIYIFILPLFFSIHCLPASESTNKVFQTILLPSNAQILSSDDISLGEPIYSFNLAITNYVVWDNEKNRFTYPLAQNAQYIGGEINTFFDVFEDSLYVGKQEVYFKGSWSAPHLNRTI